jgi:hypothetical protein
VSGSRPSTTLNGKALHRLFQTAAIDLVCRPLFGTRPEALPESLDFGSGISGNPRPTCRLFVKIVGVEVRSDPQQLITCLVHWSGILQPRPPFLTRLD